MFVGMLATAAALTGAGQMSLAESLDTCGFSLDEHTISQDTAFSGHQDPGNIRRLGVSLSGGLQHGTIGTVQASKPILRIHGISGLATDQVVDWGCLQTYDIEASENMWPVKSGGDEGVTKVEAGAKQKKALDRRGFDSRSTWRSSHPKSPKKCDVRH